MDSLAELSKYKRLLDARIEQYCQELLSTSEGYTQYSRVAADGLCQILRRGGKRLRGALVMNAYEMVGGADRQVSLRAGLALELIHAYLLIIDDICDRSVMRRGGKSAHVVLTDYHKEHTLHGDSEHFGMSVAMNTAMLGAHLAQVELTKLDVDETIRLAVVREVNEVLAQTIHGQFNDLFNEAVQRVSETEVMQVLEWKTAYYSFLSPIVVGMRLAGVVEAPEVIKDYTRNLGLAFQIVDDVLGTFGNEFESGKSATDDMREGKVTLMVAYALEHATVNDRTEFLRWLGNEQITSEGLAVCKKIMQECGAVDYAKDSARSHADKAVAALDEAPTDWVARNVEFLRGLAEFIVTRSS